MTSSMVHVRVEERIKARATSALRAMGMSVSDAVRVLLIRVATERKLPFDVCIPHVPNAKTAAAIRAGRREHEAGTLRRRTVEEFIASVKADAVGGGGK